MKLPTNPCLSTYSESVPVAVLTRCSQSAGRREDRNNNCGARQQAQHVQIVSALESARRGLRIVVAIVHDANQSRAIR